MNKSKFGGEQIKALRSNCNVDKCSDKAITYNKEFKIRAVRQYNEEGKTAREIFVEAGLGSDILGKYAAKDCLKNWRRIFKTKGVVGLKADGRGRGGGRPKTKELTDTDKIKRMEAEIAYLKAENDFLAKLRAKRAE